MFDFAAPPTADPYFQPQAQLPDMSGFHAEATGDDGLFSTVGGWVSDAASSLFGGLFGGDEQPAANQPTPQQAAAPANDPAVVRAGQDAELEVMLNNQRKARYEADYAKYEEAYRAWGKHGEGPAPIPPRKEHW
jgi:hypothetical protein